MDADSGASRAGQSTRRKRTYSTAQRESQENAMGSRQMAASGDRTTSRHEPSPVVPVKRTRADRHDSSPAAQLITGPGADGRQANGETQRSLEVGLRTFLL